MGKDRPELIHGTLDLLILQALAGTQLHGWAVSRKIRETSEGTLEINQGSLYPALYRLEDRGWIVAGQARAENGRHVKAYSLTARGRKRLLKERDYWFEFVRGVGAVLNEPAEEWT